MADIILKDSSTGKIWVDGAGKVLKARKFSETVLQNGLGFWGIVDRQYLTLVDGLVSEAYDIRGTGEKMIQNTVAYRPAYTQGLGYINFPGSISMMSKTLSSSIYTSFLVAAFSTSGASNGGRMGIGQYNSTNRMGNVGGAVRCHIGNVEKPYYLNAVKKTASAVPPNMSIVVMHSFVDGAMLSGSVNVGKLYATTVDEYLFEWGWYTRLLTEIEVIYNVNALMKKYGLTI